MISLFLLCKRGRSLKPQKGYTLLHDLATKQNNKFGPQVHILKHSAKGSLRHTGLCSSAKEEVTDLEE